MAFVNIDFEASGLCSEKKRSTSADTAGVEIFQVERDMGAHMVICRWRRYSSEAILREGQENDVDFCFGHKQQGILVVTHSVADNYYQEMP
ncbi:MAG: hypothetical protein NUV63_02855 [Gallionella sp.]|nr:hypothetical protein [Gallionella sp.]